MWKLYFSKIKEIVFFIVPKDRLSSCAIALLSSPQRINLAIVNSLYVGLCLIFNWDREAFNEL